MDKLSMSLGNKIFSSRVSSNKCIPSLENQSLDDAIKHIKLLVLKVYSLKNKRRHNQA